MVHPDTTEIILLSTAVVAGAVAGWLFGRMGRAALRSESERLEAELTRAVSQNRTQMRNLSKLRGEQSQYANIARMLPGMVRHLNRSNLDPRSVPNLIVQFAAGLFEAEQVLLFLVEASGGGSRELKLRAQHGLERPPRSGGRIPLGEGKIGWVAENRVEMASEDWLNLSRTDGRSIGDNDHAFRLDLLGPLVHHTIDGEQVLGVLCVGGPRALDDKLMLQMVTNLGSIALMNAHNLEQLKKRADHDGLTGLLNKRAFLENVASRTLVECEKSAKPYSFFIFDIDLFKRYNDSHGHLAGDELLKAVPRVLLENIRSGDVACRYGGEEFIVAMPETDAATALDAAEKIRQAIESFPFPHGKSQPNGNLTISGGVATFPENGHNSTELISHADQALYQAKAAGRNRVVQHRGVQIGDPDAEPAWPSLDVPATERLADFGRDRQ